MVDANVAISRESWYGAPPDAVALRLETDPTTGLTEAEASRRLTTSGQNVIKPVKRESVWKVFLELIREPLMLLLFGIGILYSIWGGWQDALTIVVIILIMVGAELVTDYRSTQALAGLTNLAEPTARVRRERKEEEVPAASVVPGDVLIISAGRRVAADARLIDSFGLAVDESAMTGESVPVNKTAAAVLEAATGLGDRVNMVYAGTLPIRGRGVAVAVETGARTELGKIAAATGEAEQPETPLQKNINELAKWMVVPALAISMLVPVLGVVLAHQSIQRMVLTGLSLVFSMIPEELPLIITTVLAVGCYRLAKKGALAKRMQAAETLGDVTVIASDKTGTLTEGRLMLSEVEPATARGPLLELAAISASSKLTEATDPFDLGFLDAASRSGVDAAVLRDQITLVNEFAFDTTRDRMSVVLRRGGVFEVVVRGAPEAVLAQCDLPPEEKWRLSARADELASKGLRLLALADKTMDAAPADAAQAESNLVFVGLAAFVDPPRAGVPAAIAACLEADIRVLMVTGDHPETALAIANKIGIKTGELLLGPDAERMSDAELAAALARSPIMARFTPALKQRVVAALEKQGEFVAVTGDGINDAPALALAHVGVAMGKRGTDVAREAADVVLAEDNFATVEQAVEEGRVIHVNLKKGVRFYLAFKLALSAATLLPVLLLFPVTFAPIQIIMTELFLDVGGSTTFTTEPAEEGIMRGRPYDPRAPFMDRSMVGSIIAAALGPSLAVILAYTLALNAGLTLAVAQTMAFVTLLLATALLANNLRSEREPLLKLRLTSNLPMLVWSVAMVGFAVISVLLPPAHQLFKTVALTSAEWVTVLALAVVSTMWIEAAKVFRMITGGRSSRAARAQAA